MPNETQPDAQIGAVAGELPNIDERLAAAEARLGVTFIDRRLLLQALLHRSLVLERERDGQQPLTLASNERLEFLGDAVLSMLVAHLAFRRFPDADEGRLTEIRSGLVRRSTLAVLAERLDLGRLMYMGRQETRSGGRGRATVLAEAFEAVLAAVFLDQGLEAAERFIERQLEGQVEALLAHAGGLNAKSRLQEAAQAHLRVIPEYTLLQRSGPAHDSRFVAEVRAGAYRALGEGSSRRLAEQDAAQRLFERHGADIEATDPDAAGTGTAPAASGGEDSAPVGADSSEGGQIATAESGDGGAP